jgi:hypothetical protein
VIAEIFLLAIAAMFWPFLLVVDVVAFRTSRPVAILVWFLVGGFLTTIGLGVLAVYLLRSSHVFPGASKPSTDAGTDLVVGFAAVAVALVAWHRRNHSRKTDSGNRSTSTSERIERLVAKGGVLAFVAGILTNVVPGVFPFIALKDIAELPYGPVATIALITGFYIVMFTFIEVPLLTYLLAPTWAETTVSSFNRWLEHNARKLVVGALTIFGLLEIAHGIVVLAT